jgi:serine/threonine protein phosphatase PrpC
MTPVVHPNSSAANTGTTPASIEEARHYFDQDMAEADIHRIAGGRAAVYSARCPDKQTPNEDAAALVPFGHGAAVLMVADGLGGVRAGEQASMTAVRAIEAALAEALERGLPVRVGILNGIERANSVVTELGLGAATTLALLEVQENVVRPYHVGDSLMLIVGGRGTIKLQTVSHSPVGFAVESGLLDETEAMHHEDRHIVSNVIGAPDMRIEVGSALKLATHDSVLLASDGLADNLHTEEIVARLHKGPLKRAAAALATNARQRMTQPEEGQPSKPDDVTFVAFRRRKS